MDLIFGPLTAVPPLRLVVQLGTIMGHMSWVPPHRAGGSNLGSQTTYNKGDAPYSLCEKLWT